MPFPPGRRPNGPIRPTDRRPGVTGRPASPTPSQAMAIHFEMAAAQFARSVANSERYLVALRADQALERLDRQDGRYHLPRGLQRYLTEVRHPFSPAWLSQHAPPTAFIGPAATDLERQRAHVRATNPTEIGFVMCYDPVVRVSGVGIVVVMGAEVAAAALTEEAAAYAAWRWFGWGAAGTRFGANVIGQEIGYTAQLGDPAEAFLRINWVSPFLSAAGAPLMTTSILSAAFKFNGREGYKSVFNGRITGPAMVKDAALGYGFGQLTRVSGLDDWHKSQQAQSLAGGLRYQISLRLTSRWATGVSAAVPAVVEASNRAASSAVRKYGTEEVKKHLPE